MYNNKEYKINLYNLAIIARHELKIKINEIKYRRDQLGEEEPTIFGMLQMQTYDTMLDNTKLLLDEYDKTIDEIENELFYNNNIVSIANDIINGGK